MLGPTLATIHNLHFYQELMSGIRAAIEAGRFREYAAEVTRRWQEGERARLADVQQRGG